MMMPIKVKCKKCGKDAKSDEFILDPVYKMMVCRECVKERKMNELQAKKDTQSAQRVAQQEQQKKQMPAGWDSEDAEIERKYREKQSQVSSIERIDDDRVKYTCKKCKYSFTYYISQKKPGRCSYCGTPVQV
jgi:hypothetical protein